MSVGLTITRRVTSHVTPFVVFTVHYGLCLLGTISSFFLVIQSPIKH